jgi:hypothetical protein
LSQPSRDFEGGEFVMTEQCWRRPKTEPLMRVVPTQN